MKIDPAVSGILARAAVDGNAVTLNGQLDRAMYAKVNKVLEAAGGKWNRKAQAHLFPEPAGPVLAALLSDGAVATAQDEGYFPTPAPVVARILMLAGLKPGMTVLEPSAGDGAIAGPATSYGCWVDCVELNAKRATALRVAGFARSVADCDFLAVTPHRIYDRVLMNPPFAGKQDIAHVRHALGFVKPGGLLVAVMSAGVEFRQDKTAAGFRALVAERGGSIERLPDDAFEQSGTSVRTVLVTIPVPAAQPATETAQCGEGHSYPDYETAATAARASNSRGAIWEHRQCGAWHVQIYGPATSPSPPPSGPVVQPSLFDEEPAA